MARISFPYKSGPGGANASQRRRAQNRDSQRAFRERKIHHANDLQARLNELTEVHLQLRNAYQSQADQVDTLSTQIGKLHKEITTLRMPARSGVDVFPDSDSDGHGAVVKLEFNESPFGWKFDSPVEPEMAFDWYSNPTPVMSTTDELLGTECESFPYF